MLGITFSRRLAVVGGLALPVLETVRRWDEWPGPVTGWIPWVDDYILGGVLLVCAWLSRGSNETRRLGLRSASWMTAGWGFVCGCGFGSALAQLQYVIDPALQAENADPSGFSHLLVTLVKAGLVSIGLVGLLASMRSSGEVEVGQSAGAHG